MASQKHLKKLLELLDLDDDVEAWNGWRQQNPNVTPDLSGIKIDSLCCGTGEWGQELPGFLGDINLERAILSGTKFRDVDLSGANFARAVLARANFSGANLENANFSGANLAGANLQGACLRNVVLKGAYLVGTNFEGVDFSVADLSGVDFRGAIFRGKIWKRVNFKGAVLNGAIFTEDQIVSVLDALGIEIDKATTVRSTKTEGGS